MSEGTESLREARRDYYKKLQDTTGPQETRGNRTSDLQDLRRDYMSTRDWTKQKVSGILQATRGPRDQRKQNVFRMLQGTTGLQETRGNRDPRGCYRGLEVYKRLDKTESLQDVTGD